MTMKLPIILSTMIAALATPGALASQADSATSDAGGAMAAAPDAGAMATSDTMATSDNTAAPDAATAAKPAAKKKEGKHHRKHHRKHRRGSSGPGHTPDKWDAPYDEVNKDAGDGCSGSSDDSGKRLPEEVPGQKGPRVPAGE